MKTLLLLLYFSSTILFAQYKTGEELLSAMHKKYYQKYSQSIEYDKKEINQSDTILSHIWLQAQDKYRIDVSKAPLFWKYDCLICKNDSFFYYKENKLIKKTLYIRDSGAPTFWESNRSMSNEKIDWIFDMFKGRCDLSKVEKKCKDTVCIYIIGTERDSARNGYTIYVDTKTLRVKRIHIKEGVQSLTYYYSELKEGCNLLTVQKNVVTTPFNGKERTDSNSIKYKYTNIKNLINIPDSIFNKK